MESFMVFFLFILINVSTENSLCGTFIKLEVCVVLREVGSQQPELCQKPFVCLGFFRWNVT